MGRGRAKTDQHGGDDNDDLETQESLKRKITGEDNETDRPLKSKKSKDRTLEQMHDNGTNQPNRIFAASAAIPESDDSSEDGSLSDVYAYAADEAIPAPVIAHSLVPSSSSSNDKELHPYTHPEQPYGNSRHRWTLEMDNLLREAWNTYGKQWKKIAAHVGHGKDRSQCQHRWAVYLDPQLSLRKNGPWSDEETSLLRELVEKHRNVKNGNDSSTNWVAVAKETGRSYKECRNKWKVLTAPTGKKGPFTEAEDQLIILGVREWTVKKPGLWTALQKVLNRRAKSICRRWTHMLSQENVKDPMYAELMKGNGMKGAGGDEDGTDGK